jgi:hypothetical protein
MTEPTGAGLTFEKVWAMFEETGRRMQETDRRMQETDRRMQETDRKISKLGGRLGELIEHLVASNILEKFNKLGYSFGKTGLNVKFVDSANVPLAEVDILLEDGEEALAVEVKSKLSVDDVREHIQRMEKLRRYADEHHDRRRLVAAVAGAIIGEGVKPFALKHGFYVISQAGDTVKIDVPEGFVPKAW